MLGRYHRLQSFSHHVEIASELGDLILAALETNPLFIAAALPLKVVPPLFNRYEGGSA